MNKNQLLAMLAIVSLASCGSGGGNKSSAGLTGEPKSVDTPPVQDRIYGSYDGVTSSGRKVSTIFSGSGEIWTVYSSVSNSSVIGGFAYGKSASYSGKMTASVKDFNLEGAGVISGTAAADYKNGQSIEGSITYPGIKETVGFSGTFDPSYAIVAYIRDIYGAYDAIGINEFADENVDLAIASDGSLSGVGESGCKFSGSVSIDSSNHLFTVRILFGGSPCLYSRQDFRGIATYDMATKSIGSMVINTGESAGFVLLGKKK